MAAAAPAKRLEWAPRALDAYLATRRGERRYPIPDTGHVINYRATRRAIRAQLWYRARQHLVRR